MSPGRLSIEERKQVLKWYWKFENIAEVQREWSRQFGTSPPTRLTISRLREKFEKDGTVQDVCQRYSGRPPTGIGLLEDHMHNEPEPLVTSHEKPQQFSSEKPLYIAPPDKLLYVPAEKPQCLHAEKPLFIPQVKPQYVHTPEKPQPPLQYRPTYDLSGITRENLNLLLRATK